MATKTSPGTHAGGVSCPDARPGKMSRAQPRIAEVIFFTDRAVLRRLVSGTSEKARSCDKMEIRLKYARNERVFISLSPIFESVLKHGSMPKEYKVTFQSIECGPVLEPGEVTVNAIPRPSRTKVES